MIFLIINLSPAVMKFKLFLLIILIGIAVFFVASAIYHPTEQTKKLKQPVNKFYKAGIVLTFDDDYIDDWYDAEKVLRPYNWKATFFICRYSTFTPGQKQKLRHLKAAGHDIAGHGFNHLNAIKYAAEFGLDKYINDEILPLKAAMAKDGFDIRSFAYPDGAHSVALDKELLKYFDIIRGTTYGELAPESQYCYYQGERVIYGLGIDDDYKQFNVPYYKTLIDYAKAHDKIVIFYGHKIIENADEKLETPLHALEDLCRYASEKGLTFYTVDELKKI